MTIPSLRTPSTSRPSSSHMKQSLSLRCKSPPEAFIGTANVSPLPNTKFCISRACWHTWVAVNAGGS